MTEENAAAFGREGSEAFPAEATAEETAADSQSEEENQEGDTQSSEGENAQSEEEDVPFHKHKRWTEREEEWNNRFNEQERRHQEDLKSIREEFGQKRADNAAATKIPAWFGGTQEQWDAYRQDRDAELKEAEERAEKRAVDRLKKEQGSEAKAVEEATAYLRSEITAIEGDKTLNPAGTKIDAAMADKLLKTVLENELIDTKGRWNYRAGWRLLNAGQTQAKPTPKPQTAEKKETAAVTTNSSKGGSDKEKPAIATSESFRRDRPW